MLFVVLLVLFVMVQFIWLLGLLGVMPEGKTQWLAWFAVLFLGIVVFLVGSGTVTVARW